MRTRRIRYTPLAVVLLFAGLMLAIPLLATARPADPPPSFAYAWSTEADAGVTLTLEGGTAARDVTLEVIGSGGVSDPAVVRRTDGFFTIWGLSRCLEGCSVGVTDLHYRLLADDGTTQTSVMPLTDHSTAPVDTYDREPAAAVAPNEQIGILWHRFQFTSTTAAAVPPVDIGTAVATAGASADNVYFAVLDANGTSLHTGPTALTDFELGPNTPLHSRPRIAATDDNRFVTAWKQSRYDGSAVTDTLYYAVFDNDGTAVIAPTQLLTETGNGSALGGVSLVSLGDRAMVATIANGDPYVGLLNSNGVVASPTTPLVSDTVYDTADPDAAALSNGNILLVWTAYDATTQQSTIRYAILDRNLQVVAGPHFLTTPNGDDGRHASVAVHEEGAVIVWVEQFSEGIYYAAVDASGTVTQVPRDLRPAQSGAQFVVSPGSAAAAWATPLTERLYLPLVRK